jgi:dienelactone hydrolase
MRWIIQGVLLFLLAAHGYADAADAISIPSLDNKLTLSAWWFPVETTQPRPAVITLHGCSGTLDDKGNLNGGPQREASYFNAEKMHLLVLDSFTPRGLKSICETPEARRTVHDEDRRADVFAAIQWLAKQPGVDATRIAIVGRSHGGSAVLSTLDRTDRFVQAQPIQPRAGVALYPGCLRQARMWNYELSAPLLLMIGEADDWTPATYCVELRGKVMRAQKDAVFDLHLFPDAHHAFDGMAPVHTMTNIGNTRSGTATVGANPPARNASRRLMFDFLAAQFGEPLRLSHEERFDRHRYAVPPATGFARIDDVAAVPIGEQGHARYEHYLAQPAPKAFVITEKGGWYQWSGDPEAMRISLASCKKRCWLYAVDDSVVWDADPARRTGLDQLKHLHAP